MFHMKRTTLMLDEDLLDEAIRLSGEKSYSAVVRRAVEDLVRKIKARQILSLRGSGFWEGSLAEMRELTGNQVTLLGSIPPRDVLAAGTADDVTAAVAAALSGAGDRTRLILSCGGGMPPAVGTENIQAFLAAARN